MKEYTNVFMVGYINIIGGVESFLFYLAKKYKDRDITIIYDKADANQVDRIRKYARIYKWRDGEKIKCKRAFFQYGTNHIEDIDAEDYIYVVHADYKRQKIKYKPHPKITRHFAVSNVAKNSFLEAFGIECELMYNPMDITPEHHVLRLISATRLTPEKGGDRMNKLAAMMKRYRIPYKWDVYTYSVVDTGYFDKCSPRLDITELMPQYDYLVQLSDTEAYCYSVREALALGVPCLVTDIPTFREVGVEEGKTGYLLPLDMKISEDHLRKIAKGLPEFKHIDVKDEWSKVLGRNKSTYTEAANSMITTEILKPYFDVMLNRNMYRKERVEMPYIRAVDLEEKGVLKIVEVEE